MRVFYQISSLSASPKHLSVGRRLNVVQALETSEPIPNRVMLESEPICYTMESHSLSEQSQALLLDFDVYRFGCGTMRSPFPSHPVSFVNCGLLPSRERRQPQWTIQRVSDLPPPILVPYRASRRAVFRRVAGGVSR